MIIIFEINDSGLKDKKYIIDTNSKTEAGTVSLKELSLDGTASQESLSVCDSLVKQIESPSLPWRAAFMVWKNSSFFCEANVQESEKYKNKLIELLAYKHNIEPEKLFKVLDELEEVGYFD